MCLPIFSKCCGCISLRKGSLIIGYLQLIAALSAILVIVLDVVVHSILKDRIYEHQVIIVFTVTFIAAGLALPFCIVLLIGLHKNEPGYVKVFLIFSVAYIIFIIIVHFVRAISPSGLGMVMSYPGLFFLLLYIYFLLVINSQYVVMRDSD